MIRFITAAAALCAFALAAPMSHAQDVNSVVLTIDGKIEGGATRDFSMGELEALGTTVIETTTPWHKGKIRFEGVPLQRLMEHVGASGEIAAVLALNNYRAEVPLSDFAAYPVILATKKDGAYMPVSDKGPFFIIYPFDSFEELKNELYYSRSAWQVRSITIE
jgi:hypothetical protein